MMKCEEHSIFAMDVEGALTLCDSFPKLFDMIDDSSKE